MNISGVTIRNGTSQNGGGGLLNAGILTLTNSTVSGNTLLLAMAAASYNNAWHLTHYRQHGEREQGRTWRRRHLKQLHIDDYRQHSEWEHRHRLWRRRHLHYYRHSDAHQQHGEWERHRGRRRRYCEALAQ